MGGTARSSRRRTGPSPATLREWPALPYPTAVTRPGADGTVRISCLLSDIAQQWRSRPHPDGCASRVRVAASRRARPTGSTTQRARGGRLALAGLVALAERGPPGMERGHFDSGFAMPIHPACRSRCDTAPAAMCVDAPRGRDGAARPPPPRRRRRRRRSTPASRRRIARIRARPDGLLGGRRPHRRRPPRGAPFHPPVARPGHRGARERPRRDGPRGVDRARPGPARRGRGARPVGPGPRGPRGDRPADRAAQPPRLPRAPPRGASLARAPARPLSLVVFDLDRFKRSTTRYGHAAGDAVLREVARRLRGRRARASWSPASAATSSRWLLPGADAEDARRPPSAPARAIAADAVRRRPRADDLGRRLRPGAGRRRRPSCCALADGALYWAKSNGRDAACRYAPDVVEELSAAERAERLERPQALAARARARPRDRRQGPGDDRATPSASPTSPRGSPRRSGWAAERVARLHDAGARPRRRQDRRPRRDPLQARPR